MSAEEIRGLFLRIAADLRALAEEKLKDGEPETALRLAEEAARAERQAQAAGKAEA